MDVARNDGAACEEDVDEKVLADTEADCYSEWGKEEATENDEAGESVVVLPGKVDLAVVGAWDSVTEQLRHCVCV